MRVAGFGSQEIRSTELERAVLAAHENSALVDAFLLKLIGKTLRDRTEKRFVFAELQRLLHCGESHAFGYDRVRHPHAAEAISGDIELVRFDMDSESHGETKGD